MSEGHVFSEVIMKRLVIALSGIALSFSAAAAQVPPPPPLPGQNDLGRALVADFAHKDLAAYPPCCRLTFKFTMTAFWSRIAGTNGCAASDQNSQPRV